MDFKVKGIEARKKIVAEGGTSGRVYLPKSWVGKKVIAILMEEER